MLVGSKLKINRPHSKQLNSFSPAAEGIYLKNRRLKTAGGRQYVQVERRSGGDTELQLYQESLTHLQMVNESNQASQ